MCHGKSLGSFDGPPIILYIFGWATKQKPMSTFIQGRRKPGGPQRQPWWRLVGVGPPSLLSSLNIMINIIAVTISKVVIDNNDKSTSSKISLGVY
jgi:hypothetical protein